MEPYIKSEWGYQVYMSPFRSNRRGVMILLNNNFDQKVENFKTDPNGNFIIYSNKKDTSDFHGTVSFDPIEMSQQNIYQNVYQTSDIQKLVII